MSLVGLGLVLFAALLHATWNFLSKRVAGGSAFTWLCDCCCMCMWAPVVLIFSYFDQPHFTWAALGAISVSAVLQASYLFFLQRGYKIGDFSLVYPIARGCGAGGAMVGGVLILGESLSLLSGTGALILLSGILLIATSSAKAGAANKGDHRASIAYGLATGVCIMSYTLWDKTSVTTIGLAPILLYYGVVVLRTVALAPVALSQRSQIAELWRKHKASAMAVGILMFMGYVIVLSAMTFSNASIVAPVRETSILFGAMMGQSLLKEGDTKRRLIAAALIVLGLAGIILGS
jgi:drug/metabolite transporter (DMT)-like permease